MGCGKSKVKKLTEDNEKVLESNHFNSTEAVAATTFDDSVNVSPTMSLASAAETAEVQDDPGETIWYYSKLS